MSTEIKKNGATEDVAVGLDTNHLFPVFLRLETLEVLVVGAGNVGLEKLNAILGNSPAARVSVIATNVSEQVKELAEKHAHVTIAERAFEETDLDGKDLVIIAINDKSVSQTIRDIARENPGECCR
jgi:uncharacterized protein